MYEIESYYTSGAEFRGGSSLSLRGMSTPGHGQGEGSAGDKFRVSGTQETVEGAGAHKVSGVLSETGCCRLGTPLIKKQGSTLFLRISP